MKVFLIWLYSHQPPWPLSPGRQLITDLNVYDSLLGINPLRTRF